MKYLLGTFYYLWKLYIGFAFIITLILFYPFLLFFIYYEPLKHLTFKVNILWSRSMRILCFYAVEKTGEYNVNDAPSVLVANHTSYLDIFLLYSILPQHKFLFMGKSELLKYPLVKTFFKRLNIPVDRENTVNSARAFIKAKKEMNNNWSIAIFPEGGIVDPTSRLASFKNGAFQLAKFTKRTVLPITFKNNYYLFSDPSYFFLPAMPGIVKVHIHPIISTEYVVEHTVDEINEKAFKIIKSAL